MTSKELVELCEKAGTYKFPPEANSDTQIQFSDFVI